MKSVKNSMNEIKWKINLNDIICLWLCLQAQKSCKVLKCKGLYNNSKPLKSRTTMCSVIHTSDVSNNIIIFSSCKNMALLCNYLCLVKWKSPVLTFMFSSKVFKTKMTSFCTIKSHSCIPWSTSSLSSAELWN